MGAVDAWAQITTDRFVEQPWLTTLFRWTREESPKATSASVTIKAMNDGGVEVALISAWHGPNGSLVSNDDVADAVNAFPDRLVGVAAVDLSDPMGATREIRRRAAEGFVGVRVVPWLWDLPPNDRRYYPVYVACIEAGVPFCTQIGHTGPLRRSETGRPIPYLEDVLLDFPELVIVGGHVGFPWIDEVLSLARKFRNFYVDTSAYAVHRLPPDLVTFMRGQGRARVLFGTNWPMLSPAQCLEGLNALGLDDEARHMFLEGNARHIFRLEATETTLAGAFSS